MWERLFVNKQRFESDQTAIQAQSQERTVDLENHLNKCDMQLSLDQAAATNALNELSSAIEGEESARRRLQEARDNREAAERELRDASHVKATLRRHPGVIPAKATKLPQDHP